MGKYHELFKGMMEQIIRRAMVREGEKVRFKIDELYDIFSINRRMRNQVSYCLDHPTENQKYIINSTPEEDKEFSEFMMKMFMYKYESKNKNPIDYLLEWKSGFCERQDLFIFLAFIQEALLPEDSGKRLKMILSPDTGTKTGYAIHLIHVFTREAAEAGMNDLIRDASYKHQLEKLYRQ